MERYKKQLVIMNKICKVFEETASADAHNAQNTENHAEKVQFDSILDLNAGRK